MSRLLIVAGVMAVLAPDARAQTIEVPALRETQAVASLDDAADDPAIWRNAADPLASLIVATDKKAGLYVYGLDGKVRSHVAAGRVNNVDLREGAPVRGAPRVLVAASDRTDVLQAKIALFTLDGTTGLLTALGSLPVADGEAYGMCLWRRARDGAVFAFSVLKDGSIVQSRLDLSGAEPRAEVVRRAKLNSQSEGCAADDRTGIVYIAEEDVGLWRLDADPAGSSVLQPVARADGRQLVADVEGVAIAPQGKDGGYLVVSSQGDSAYALYALPEGRFQGRFRIVANATGTDGASQTDGVDVTLGSFGPDFPDGLLVVQDGDNAPEAQNFKLVSWRDVRNALPRP